MKRTILGILALAVGCSPGPDVSRNPSAEGRGNQEGTVNEPTTAPGQYPDATDRTGQPVTPEGTPMGQPSTVQPGTAEQPTTVQPGATGQVPGTTQTAALSDDARKILTRLHEVSAFSVASGQLAAERGSQAVKDYAKNLVQEQQKTDNQLVTIAKQYNFDVTTAETMPDSYKRKLDDLSKETGRAFDKDFRDEMIDGYQSALKDAQDAAKNVTEPAVRDFLTGQVIPGLQKHLDDAKAIQVPSAT